MAQFPKRRVAVESGGMPAKAIFSGSDPWAPFDGRPVNLGGPAPGAPTGTPQYPTLLNAYPTATPPNTRVRWPITTGTQPPWMVAGVDYYVGVDRVTYPILPSGGGNSGSFIDVTDNVAPYHGAHTGADPTGSAWVGRMNGIYGSGSDGVGCVSYDASNHNIGIRQTGVTLEGIDLSLNGGIVVTCLGPAGMVTSGPTLTGGAVGVAATGSIAFQQFLPVSKIKTGDNFTLNGTVVTYVTGTPVGNQVQIAGTLALTVDATVTFLNASADAQISLCTYAASGSPHTGINITFKTTGTGGNSFTLAANVPGDQHPTDVRIKNNYYKSQSGTPNQASVMAVSDAGANMYIGYNTIDGNGPNITDNLTFIGGCFVVPGPNAIIEYNHFYQWGSTPIQIVFQTGLSDNCIIRYNLYDRCMWVTGSHGEPVQQLTGGSNCKNVFNTVYMPAADVNGGPHTYGTSGLFFLQISNDCNGLEIGNNTVVSGGITGHKDGPDIHSISGGISGTATFTADRVPDVSQVPQGSQILDGYRTIESPAFPNPTYASWTTIAPFVVSLWQDAGLTTPRNLGRNLRISPPGSEEALVPWSLNFSAINQLVTLEAHASSVNSNTNVHDNYYDLDGVAGFHCTTSGTFTGLSYAGNRSMRTGAALLQGDSGPSH